MFKTISIDELQPGMYVEKVLAQTGHLTVRSKGLVKSASTINSLKSKGILQLEINLSKSVHEQHTTATPTPAVNKPKVSESQSLNQANALYLESVQMHGVFIEKLREGEATDLGPVEQISQHIIDSVFDNPEALGCLTLIKNADQYLLEHSLNSSILMAIFAKSLDIDSHTCEELTLAALLMDVGMASVPTDILYKKGQLNEQEWSIIRTHVDVGIELIEQAGEVSDITLDIVANHHERLDGSGYPRGVSSDDLSLYARMAAIVDSYDAMTSDRPFQKAITPRAAMKRLLADSGLDSELTQQFIKAMGVHPVGSLVKLSSGKLAIVIRNHDEHPLDPTVACFYSVNGGYQQIKRMDLHHYQDEIEASVRPEEFKINLNKFFRDVFLNSL